MTILHFLWTVNTDILNQQTSIGKKEPRRSKGLIILGKLQTAMITKCHCLFTNASTDLARKILLEKVQNTRGNKLPQSHKREQSSDF